MSYIYADFYRKLYYFQNILKNQLIKKIMKIFQ